MSPSDFSQLLSHGCDGHRPAASGGECAPSGATLRSTHEVSGTSRDGHVMSSGETSVVQLYASTGCTVPQFRSGEDAQLSTVPQCGSIDDYTPDIKLRENGAAFRSADSVWKGVVTDVLVLCRGEVKPTVWRRHIRV